MSGVLIDRFIFEIYGLSLGVVYKIRRRFRKYGLSLLVYRGISRLFSSALELKNCLSMSGRLSKQVEGRKSKEISAE